MVTCGTSPTDLVTVSLMQALGFNLPCAYQVTVGSALFAVLITIIAASGIIGGLMLKSSIEQMKGTNK
jgi:hypothetical protein